MSGCSKYPCRWLTDCASQINGNDVAELNGRDSALLQTVYMPNLVTCLTTGNSRKCPFNEDRVIAEYVKSHFEE